MENVKLSIGKWSNCIWIIDTALQRLVTTMILVSVSQLVGCLSGALTLRMIWMIKLILMMYDVHPNGKEHHPNGQEDHPDGSG